MAMADTTALDVATKRLAAALDALEAAFEQRREAGESRRMLGEQLHAIGNDRAHLAAQLDDALARSHEMEATHREIARRVDAAMAGIQSVLTTSRR